MIGQGIEWVPVRKFGNDPIGAVGFINNKAVVVVAFYDDRDGNQDGRVSTGEWVASKLSPIRLDGRAVTEVAMQARVDMEILRRDASFATTAAQMYMNFATGLIKDGIYAAYFRRGVTLSGKGIATHLTSSAVKGFAIRKGYETAVKKAFDAAVAR